MRENGWKSIFSHCVKIDENDNILGFSNVKDPDQYNVLTYPNFIPQPTVFFRDIVFETTGYLNENFFLAMDIDYWRRITKRHKIKLIRDTFACFRLHNDSKTTKYLKFFKYESKQSFFQNGGSIFSPYYFETFIKPILLSLFVYNPFVRKIFFNGK